MRPGLGNRWVDPRGLCRCWKDWHERPVESFEWGKVGCGSWRPPGGGVLGQAQGRRLQVREWHSAWGGPELDFA